MCGQGTCAHLHHMRLPWRAAQMYYYMCRIFAQSPMASALHGVLCLSGARWGSWCMSVGVVGSPSSVRHHVAHALPPCRHVVHMCWVPYHRPTATPPLGDMVGLPPNTLPCKESDKPPTATCPSTPSAWAPAATQYVVRTCCTRGHVSSKRA